VIFFVTLGMQLNLISKEFVLLILVLLVLVIIIKPLVIMFFVRMCGYKKRTSFFTGNSLAQTSEFSLIIVTIGLGLGHISQGLFSTLVLLTIITMSFTSYLIVHERRLSGWFSWPLNILDGFKTKKEELEYIDDGKKVIIFGCHRMGSLILKEFKKNKKELMVVDFNPEIIRSLIDKKIPCIYGDFMHEEILDKLGLKKAETIISTIPDFEDNMLLIKKTREINPKSYIIVVASRISEALALYEKGADYVILPKIIGGIEAVRLIKNVGKNRKKTGMLRRDHIQYLKDVHRVLY